MVRLFQKMVRKMKQLSKRQQYILDYLSDYELANRLDIEGYIKNFEDKASKQTILRDLNTLISQNLIKKSGSTKNTTYSLVNSSDLLKDIDVYKYFQKDVDERTVKFPNFNFKIFNDLQNIFSKEEISNLEKTNALYQGKIKTYPATVMKKEYERLLIELSWKSSKIEGNTYSLLDTEILIKENAEAKGHQKEEAIMILNHKNALEFIFNNKDYFKDITLAKIEELHRLLVKDLDVNFGLRERPVGIVGTNYKPLSNKLQIKEAVKKLVECIRRTPNIIEKALITVLMISYIQPFEDGNKRTGRILANAILYANNYCPISYRSVSEIEYKKAVVIFYETNSLSYFKDMFVEQFKFAVEKYF